MGSKKLSLSTPLFIFLLLVLASERMGSVDAGVCVSQSHKFKGVCISDTNCGSVCRSEGFRGGKCDHLPPRCYCSKPCL